MAPVVEGCKGLQSHLRTTCTIHNRHLHLEWSELQAHCARRRLQVQVVKLRLTMTSRVFINLLPIKRHTPAHAGNKT